MSASTSPPALPSSALRLPPPAAAAPGSDVNHDAAVGAVLLPVEYELFVNGLQTLCNAYATRTEIAAMAARMPSVLLHASDLQHALDVELNLQQQLMSTRRVSRSVPANNTRETEPMIYGIYVPVLEQIEQDVEHAVVAYIAQLVRVSLLRYFLSRKNAVPLTSPLHDSVSVRNGVAKILVPDTGNLEQWGSRAAVGAKGNKADAVATVELDDAKLLAQLEQDSVLAVRSLLDNDIDNAASIAAVANKKAVVPLLSVLDAQLERLATNSRTLRELLFNEYRRVVLAVIGTSTHEAMQVVRRYEQSLRSLWANTPTVYRELLEQADTVEDFRRAYVDYIGTQFEQTGVVFEAYRNAAPLFRREDRVPRAPERRDYSLLFATEPGRFVVSLYEASRQLLPKHGGGGGGRSAGTRGGGGGGTSNNNVSDLRFLSEMPHNIVDSELVPGRFGSVGTAPAAAAAPLAATLLRKTTVMDRVQRFFREQLIRGVQVETAPASSTRMPTLARAEEQLDDLYTELKRRDAAAEAAVLAARVAAKAAARPARAKRAAGVV